MIDTGRGGGESECGIWTYSVCASCPAPERERKPSAFRRLMLVRLQPTLHLPLLRRTAMLDQDVPHLHPHPHTLAP